jgi:hypothetical protein
MQDAWQLQASQRGRHHGHADARGDEARGGDEASHAVHNPGREGAVPADLGDLLLEPRLLLEVGHNELLVGEGRRPERLRSAHRERMVLGQGDHEGLP